MKDLAAGLLSLLIEAFGRAAALSGRTQLEKTRPAVPAVKMIWLPSHLALLCFSWALLLAGVYWL
jgi:hypothetical protein